MVYEQVRATNHFPVYHHYGQWFLDDDNGCWFLVFEFIEGKSLKNIIIKDERLKNEVFFSLASALADIHDHKFAVGDFNKLENVFQSTDRNNSKKIVFIDCDPGEPNKPNSDYQADCLELVEISKIFGKSKPSRVKSLIKEIKSRKRFDNKTLGEIIEGLPSQ